MQNEFQEQGSQDILIDNHRIFFMILKIIPTTATTPHNFPINCGQIKPSKLHNQIERN
jgi:hypothetical protein